MTLRMSLTSWEMDEPTWPCFMIKDLGTLEVDVSCATADWRCVLVFLRLRPMCGGEREKKEVGVIFGT
jgi:hypothetical protein